ncbi:sensor histidine kinase [Streptomyces sp. NPDC050439]|uniref:sensor histidine kinase n=1 Tax=unclassified Streptomyces TaxID=2593676 RepID=UPI003415A63A
MPSPPRLSDATLRRTGCALAGVALASAALTLHVGRGLRFPAQAGEQPVPYAQLAGVVMAIPASVVLILARPRNLIGWLLLAVPVFGTAQDLCSVYAVRAQARPGEHLPWGGLAYSLGNSLWVPALCMLIVLVVFYPRGRLPAARWRWVNRALATGALSAALGLAMAPRPAAEYYRGAGPAVELPATWADTLTQGGALLATGATAVVLGGACVRVRRAPRPERQQLLWLLVALGLLLAVSFVPAWGWLLPMALGLVSFAVLVGVLWYRLLGIDLVLRRTLLYGALTAVVLFIYAVVTALVAVAVPTGPASEVAAAAVVAALLTPVRDRLQKGVDRLVYGAQNDPLGLFRRLGSHVSADLSDVLPATVASVASAVRAPYAALTATDGTLLAETGTRSAPPTVRPLIVAGTRIADLALCPADPDGFPPADARMIEALTAPVALIVHTDRLNRELRAARRHAMDVSAAERARLREDLHDGLGPSLSGVALGLEAVQTSVSGQASSLEELVRRLRDEVGRAVEEVRRVIDALRPSALDLHGLVPALRERALVLTLATGGDLQIDVEAPDTVPPLPDPVEYAAFRIAEEALANVVKHAAATHCLVRLTFGKVLTLEVHDDGRGLHPDRMREGRVGLASMRRRAEELNGTFHISARRRGNTVHVELPVDGGATPQP